MERGSVVAKPPFLFKEEYMPGSGKGRLWKLHSIWPRNGFLESSSAVAKPPHICKPKQGLDFGCFLELRHANVTFNHIARVPELR